ncbi:transposase [Paraburkholderia sp. HC6.4b]|nr:transposase [Paraburkholderia sp. HC6.4b]MBB5453880.1 transposase [Paraburkholderia sp. Kb1A]
MLDLLARYPSPAELAATSEKTLANRLTKLAPRMSKSLAAEIVQALSEQAVIVPGTQAATIVMPRLAQQLASLRKQRDEVASEVERLVHAHPVWPVLTSMPGVGVRTAARLLAEVAHKAFASAAHLAAYAGLAPVTRRSGSSTIGGFLDESIAGYRDANGSRLIQMQDSAIFPTKFFFRGTRTSAVGSAPISAWTP